jgi:flagellar motor switch protein FliN/FliY
MAEGPQIDKEAQPGKAEKKGAGETSMNLTSAMNINGAGPKPQNLDFILDIPVTVSVEVGKAKMVIHDILQLGQGSVVELDKLAGEPMEVLVQGKPVGKGEVVVVNEKFGIRLTDIISPVERIEKLR